MLETENRLRRALEQRDSKDSLRSLTLRDKLVDFCSNDYLGFSRSQILKERIRDEVAHHAGSMIGSTGSRLISGNSRYCEELEGSIADFHHAESGLIFNSGYDANIGIFSSVPQRTDTTLFDQLVHASIRDGIRLSNARSFSFRHNDVDDLERRLKAERSESRADPDVKSIFVAAESVYSMDGDFAPLTEMAEVCVRYGANLIVDEAHATGVFGKRGEGKVVELGLENKVFARVHTFGKALGSHGAIVLGSSSLRSYLINFARSFIYTTALPFHSLASIRSAYALLKSDTEQMSRLRERVKLFKTRIGSEIVGTMIQSESAIQCVVIPGNSEVKAIAKAIQESGFDVRAIMHPTVPSGAERLRICLHSFNTEEEIENLTNRLGALSQ